MAKYDPLMVDLMNQPSSLSTLRMSFHDIEAIIGVGLPPSSRSGDPRSWQNQRPGRKKGHVGGAVRDAGWQVYSVDHQRQHVELRRLPSGSGGIGMPVSQPGSL